MFGIDWQLALVLLIVATAAIWIARQVLAMFRGEKNGCGGGCGTCPSKNAPDILQLPSEPRK